MMVGLFLLFLVIQMIVFFKKRELSILLFLLNLVLMIAMFMYHVTENIPIRL